MQHCATPQAAREWCAKQRAEGLTLGYVPTMGALHAGHLALVQRAVAENDAACASIFVNPLQFNNPQDLARYPQTYAADTAMLEQAGCAMVFTGSLAGFFPEAADTAQLKPRCPYPEAQGLEGRFRPGHLDGVWAIVRRLFETVGGGRSYFGEKDFQQCLVVQQLAADLRAEGLAVEVCLCPTVREPGGLARSSRNRQLSEAGHRQARGIYQALLAAQQAWAAGERAVGVLERVLSDALAQPGIDLEYAALRDPDNWAAAPVDGRLQQAVALAACYVDGVRLIDNLRLSPA